MNRLLFIIHLNAILLMLFNTNGVSANQSSELTLTLNQNSYVSVSFKIKSIAAKAPHLFLAALPFKINENAEIKPSKDIKVALLETGNNYTILSAILIYDSSEIQFELFNAITTEKSGLNRESLDFDFNYSGMPPEYKKIIASEDCFSTYDIFVNFPFEFIPKEISISQNSWKRINSKYYFIPKSSIDRLSGNNERIFIAFPELSKLSSLIVNAFISMIVTIFNFLLSPLILNNRKLHEIILILGLSVLLLIAGVYVVFAFYGHVDIIVWYIRATGCLLIGGWYLVAIIRQIKSR